MDQKIGTYLRYLALLLPITLALVSVVYLWPCQDEQIANPGIEISYPKSILRDSCGRVKITIDENQADFSKKINSVFKSAGFDSSEQNFNTILEAALVFPGMSVDPAGEIKQPWVGDTKQAFAWKVCSNTEGSFDGTVWMYVYAYTGQDIKVEKLPVSAYPLQVNVRSIFGLTSVGDYVLLVILIAIVCSLGFFLKGHFSNRKQP